MKKTFEFYRPEDKLPETSGQYLCVYGDNHYMEIGYSAKHKAFNVSDSSDYPKHAMDVSFWAELPKRRLINE